MFQKKQLAYPFFYCEEKKMSLVTFYEGEFICLNDDDPEWDKRHRVGPFFTMEAAEKALRLPDPTVIAALTHPDPRVSNNGKWTFMIATYEKRALKVYDSNKKEDVYIDVENLIIHPK